MSLPHGRNLSALLIPQGFITLSTSRLNDCLSNFVISPPVISTFSVLPPYPNGSRIAASCRSRTPEGCVVGLDVSAQPSPNMHAIDINAIYRTNNFIPHLDNNTEHRSAGSSSRPGKLSLCSPGGTLPYSLAIPL